MDKISQHPHFFTATALDWKPLLKADHHKEIIIDSLRFLVEKEKVFVFAFVIMDNHIHLIWQMRDPYVKSNVQRDFLKFCAQLIKYDLIKNDPKLLQAFEVNKKDRKYQFWQRNSLSIEIYTPSVMEQKLTYIHENPVKAGYVDTTIDYSYSSALFYETGKSDYDFLSHHEG